MTTISASIKEMESRDISFDLIKGFAIFMVLYLHISMWRFGFELESMPSYIANFIVAVNMPLFFVVSGYFSKRLHEGGDWRCLCDRFVCYFWPMAFFAVLFTCIDSIVLNKFPIISIPLRTVKTFLFADWFFHSLAICDGITFLAYKCSKLREKLFICTLGYAVCLVGTGRLWYVGCVVNMILFYWFGLLLLPQILNRRHLFSVMAIFGGAALIFVTYFYGNVAANGMSFYNDRLDLFNPQVEKILNMVIRFIVGTFGSVFIIRTFKWVSYHIHYTVKFAFLGRETLGVYFLQGWTISNCIVPFVGVDAGIWCLFSLSMTVLLLSVFVIKLIKTSELINKIVFGLRISKSASNKKVFRL